MIVPSERSKHIILICKGHSNYNDPIDALKNFVSEWCGLSLEQVSDSSIYNLLLDAMKEVLTKNDFVSFTQDIFRFRRTIDNIDIMYQMVSYLANTKVKEDGEILIDLTV